MLGWQLFCHRRICRVSGGWQYNCHPNNAAVGGHPNNAAVGGQSDNLAYRLALSTTPV